MLFLTFLITSTIATTDIKSQIIEQANVRAPQAIKIATCESQLGKYRKNWEGSSAEGLFQFMPKTFNAYCEGDIKSDQDQIKCFLKLYPTKSHWWECSKKIYLIK